MEEVLLQLWQEVARLQLLCSEQGRLLRRLRARKGPVLDIPVSLPIQCTEDAAPGEGEKPPGSPQGHPEAPAPSPSHPEGSAHPLAQPQVANGCPPSTGINRDPPSTGIGGGTAAAAGAFGSSGTGKVDAQAWRKTWILPAPREEGRARRGPRDFEAADPEAGGCFLSVLDLYGAPEGAGRGDAPRERALPAEAPVPVEIRGPVKTSWTPGWTLEEGTLAEDVPCGAAQACDLCRELFPWDAAGQREYLTPIPAHTEQDSPPPLEIHGFAP